MKLQLLNPVELLNLKVLGCGVELAFSRLPEGASAKYCIAVGAQLLVWQGSKAWVF